MCIYKAETYDKSCLIESTNSYEVIIEIKQNMINNDIKHTSQ